jgi:uncharacterized membrane protein YccC
MATAAAIVGQGSYSSVTENRSIHRLVGSLIGVVIAFAVIDLDPRNAALAATLGGFMFLTEYFVVRNYGLAIVFLTPLALELTNAASQAESPEYLLGTRLLETILGCFCGLLVGKLVSRHWASTQLQQSLRDTRRETQLLAAATDSEVPVARKHLEFRLQRLLRVSQRTAAERPGIRQWVQPYQEEVNVTMRLAESEIQRRDAMKEGERAQ